MGKVKDEIGNIYGKLTVLQRGENAGRLATWICQCECGNVITVKGASLRSGNTKSCGCQKYAGLKKQHIIQNKSSIQVGNQYGKLTVLKELDLRPHGTQGHNRRWYLCQCECGNIIEAMGNSLQSGHKKSCGCIKSNGEAYIEQLLKENKIEYKAEVVDELLVKQYSRRLRFDFGIYKNGKLIKYIEFDGRQHKNGFDEGIWSHSETYEIIKERDDIKNQFCKEYKITLARIPYWTIKDNKLTLEDILGNKYNI